MDMLKKYFPFSFGEKKDLAALIINILIYLVVGIVAGAIIALVSIIPILGVLIGLVGALIDLYVLVGIILSVLDYLKILK